MRGDGHARAGQRARQASAAKIEAEQHATHGLAWLATYGQAIKEMAAYARRMHEEGRLGPTEELLTRIGLGEYLAQMFGGIPMNQGEIIRLSDFGLSESDIEPFRDEPVVEALMKSGNTPDNRAALVELIRHAHKGAIGHPGLDETFEAIRGEMRRFSDAEVVPHAQNWHRANAYIPLEIISSLSQMGVFGLTIPEAYGGWGSARSRCASSRRSCRAAISAWARSAPAPRSPPSDPGRRHRGAKADILPKIASGAILPTAVSPSPTPVPTSQA